LTRKALGDALPRTSATGAEPTPDDSVLVLFGDWRDKRLIDTFGATISILRRERRAELDEALAERVVPQLRKIAALELKVAELTGAIDVMRGRKEVSPPPKFPKVKAWTENTV
jgi:hypothetical protein